MVSGLVSPAKRRRCPSASSISDRGNRMFRRRCSSTGCQRGQIGKAVGRVGDREGIDPVRRPHAQLLTPLEHQTGRDAVLASDARDRCVLTRCLFDDALLVGIRVVTPTVPRRRMNFPTPRHKPRLITTTAPQRRPSGTIVSSCLNSARQLPNRFCGSP